jgi:predicted nucleotidyltransferase
MDQEQVKIKLRRDLKFLDDQVIGVLIYGSWAKGDFHEKSDIDVCIVAPYTRDKMALYRTLLSGIHDDRYDVRIFELLPLYLKIAVIDEGIVVYARDVGELYEYFYSFRRMWEDQKHRQMLDRDECLAMFAG